MKITSTFKKPNDKHPIDQGPKDFFKLSHVEVSLLVCFPHNVLLSLFSLFFFIIAVICYENIYTIVFSIYKKRLCWFISSWQWVSEVPMCIWKLPFKMPSSQTSGHCVFSKVPQIKMNSGKCTLHMSNYFLRVLRHGVKGAGSLAKLEPPSMHPQVLNSEYLNRPQRTSNCSKMDIFHPRTKVRLSLRLQKTSLYVYNLQNGSFGTEGD